MISIRDQLPILVRLTLTNHQASAGSTGTNHQQWYWWPGPKPRVKDSGVTVRDWTAVMETARHAWKLVVCISDYLSCSPSRCCGNVHCCVFACSCDVVCLNSHNIISEWTCVSFRKFAPLSRLAWVLMIVLGAKHDSKVMVILTWEQCVWNHY